MDLIDRAALKMEWHFGDVCETCERDARQCQYYDFSRMDFCSMLDDAPAVEAVPLAALCNWLAAQDFRVRGEPIVAKLDAETWANVIRECVMREA